MLDVHTHRRHPAWPAIVNVEVEDGATVLPDEERVSVGIHPWNAGGEHVSEALERQRRLAVEPRVAAIGECGLDRLRGPGMDVQERVFEAQARMAQETGKILIIHCVRAWDRLLAMRRKLCREYDSCVPWIVHGFRGNAELARQLLKAGIELSFGERFNARALAATPEEKRHTESDESELSLQQIVELQDAALRDGTP